MIINDDQIKKYMGYFKPEYSTYFLDKYPKNYFDVFVDIGACLGYMSRRMSTDNDKTKIYAYEPASEEFSVLKDTVSDLKNIKIYKLALGDGNPGTIKRIGEFIGRNVFVENGNGEIANSLTISDIFLTNNIHTNCKYAVKIDCEGGERFLIGDKKAEEILRNAAHIAMEIHFKPVPRKGKPSPHPQFDSYPEYIKYHDWIYSIFGETHNIKYHNSNKHSGLGTFVMAKFECMNKDWNFKNEK